MPMTRSELEQAARPIFDSFAAADEKGIRDLDRILAFFTEDVKYETPFLETPVKLDNAEDFRAFLGRARGLFGPTTYTLGPFTIDVETQTVVVEARSERRLLATGDTIRMRYVFIFKFRGDKVCEFREMAFSTDMETVLKGLKIN